MKLHNVIDAVIGVESMKWAEMNSNLSTLRGFMTNLTVFKFGYSGPTGKNKNKKKKKKRNKKKEKLVVFFFLKKIKKKYNL